MFSNDCPLPLQRHDLIQLAHGGGGRMTNDLLKLSILPILGMKDAGAMHDAATLNFALHRLAFTTDSYVVSPIFFPGGSIGSLAVHGTINDLAMAGAEPLFLSCGLIIEEGFSRRDLDRVLTEAADAARAAGVAIVTGDTKVVERGKGDGLYINTAGIGHIKHSLTIAPRAIVPGDALIVSGDLGRHSVAIMASRAGIKFETEVLSDSAPLHAVVADLLAAGIEIHCLRDLTRGGLASALVELAEASNCGFRVQERKVPVSAAVRGAAETLGLDPFYLANEGRCVCIVPAHAASAAVEVMRRHSVAEGAIVVGEVTSSDRGTVILESGLGTQRYLSMLSGEQLPRIC